MSVTKYKDRWRARVYHGGRPITSRVFELKRDAVAWEMEQKRKLFAGDWVDPRAGAIPLGDVITQYLILRGWPPSGSP